MSEGKDMSEVAVAEIRRGGVDRRKRPTPVFSKYTLFGGRRAGERRKDVPVEGKYVDRYDPMVLTIVLGVAIFNFFDCFFTLLQISRGATELNPFVQALLDHSPQLFIFTKSLGIGVILCFLCVHQNFKLARGTMIFAFVMYFALFIYHLLIYNWGI